MSKKRYNYFDDEPIEEFRYDEDTHNEAQGSSATSYEQSVTRHTPKHKSVAKRIAGVVKSIIIGVRMLFAKLYKAIKKDIEDTAVEAEEYDNSQTVREFDGLLPTADEVDEPADADNGTNPQLIAQGILHSHSQLLQLLAGGVGADLLHNSHIRLVDAQDKVLHFVGKHSGHHIHRSHIAVTNLADQEHRPGGIGGKVQLLCPDVNITGENVIHDNILDKGAPVMLLPQQGDIRAGDHAALGVHHAEAALRNLF